MAQPASAVGMASAVFWPPPAPQKPQDYGLEVITSIEAVLELGQLTRHMLAMYRMVATSDGVLDVTQHRVDRS